MADILHRAGVASTPDKVYDALTTVAGVAGWWSAETSGDGTRLEVRFGDAEGVDIQVIELRPHERVEWAVVGGPPEWIGTSISFDLSPDMDTRDSDWTIVLFKHAGWREPVEFMYDCSTQWAMFLMSLKSLVETGVGQPYPNGVKIHNLR